QGTRKGRGCAAEPDVAAGRVAPEDVRSKCIFAVWSDRCPGKAAKIHRFADPSLVRRGPRVIRELIEDATAFGAGAARIAAPLAVARDERRAVSRYGVANWTLTAGTGTGGIVSEHVDRDAGRPRVRGHLVGVLVTAATVFRIDDLSAQRGRG